MRVKRIISIYQFEDGYDLSDHNLDLPFDERQGQADRLTRVPTAQILQYVHDALDPKFIGADPGIEVGGTTHAKVAHKFSCDATRDPAARCNCGLSA